MQSLGQRYYREKLARLLSKTTLHDVVGMTWSGWAIQNGHADIASKFMQFSAEAEDGSAGARYVLYPWQLETLVNEALIAPLRPDRKGRSLVTQKFSAIYRLVKLIQRIEEADGRKFLESHDVLYEMHRLTQRQFEWQRGFGNMPRFYRTMQLFGQGAAADYFAEQAGLSVADFIEAGFFLFVGLATSPTRIWPNHAPPEGMRAELRTLALNRMSLTPQEAMKEARNLRANGDHIGYMPSVLRRHPIVRFGSSGDESMAPVPPLILQRISSGLYFDIVNGGGGIWAEVGKRFEAYCLRYLGAMLDGYSVSPEKRYGPRGRSFDTPDILVSDQSGVRLAVECKAKRMPVNARLSGDPVGDASAAYEEIAKGVFQVWRFFSHARRGLLEQPVAGDCLGMVVTADPWLVMGQKIYPEVMAMANAIADEKDPQIDASDRRRVPIVLIDDIEYLLQHAPASELFVRLEALSQDDTGWNWSLVHVIDQVVERPYPFASELRDLLPRIFSAGEQG